jgi:hypothetical protein
MLKGYLAVMFIGAFGWLRRPYAAIEFCAGIHAYQRQVTQMSSLLHRINNIEYLDEGNIGEVPK